MTKYVQLDHLESGWKQSYLLKRHQQGDWITRHQSSAVHLRAIALLQSNQSFLTPNQMNHWIEHHLCEKISIQLEQAMRARRKRYFDRENLGNKKKSIDLTHYAWELLSDYKEKHQLPTLSDALIQILLAEHSAPKKA